MENKREWKIGTKNKVRGEWELLSQMCKRYFHGEKKKKSIETDFTCF